MTGTPTKTFEQKYLPLRPDQLYLIGIGDTYYRLSGDKIVPRNFPHTTESIDQMHKLASKGKLFLHGINRGDIESRYWFVEHYNDDLVLFSKLIRLQNMYLRFDFSTNEVTFYTVRPNTETHEVAFRGVISTTRDFDRVVKLIGYE